MVKFKKGLITVAMVGVWGWTIFMAIMTASFRGRLASVLIGILLNGTLAIWYAYLEKRSQRSPEVQQPETGELEM
jgi:uncharacterized membrane protein YjjB (DUF3815 family)